MGKKFSLRDAIDNDVIEGEYDFAESDKNLTAFYKKMKQTHGMKYDGDKLRWDLLAWDAIEAIVDVYTYGAKKYADNNWQLIDKERYFAALCRHLVAHRKGEKVDAESGRSHLAHAAWNAITLLWFEMNEETKPEQ